MEAKHDLLRFTLFPATVVRSGHFRWVVSVANFPTRRSASMRMRSLFEFPLNEFESRDHDQSLGHAVVGQLSDGRSEIYSTSPSTAD